MISDYFDNIDFYLKEISRFPLLTKEDEQRIGKDLKLRKELKILTNGNINLNVLLVSLCNHESYKIIIQLLLNYFQTKDNINDKKIYNDLKLYEDISKKVNRSLTREELQEYFSISEEINLLEKELLIEIKKYIKYRLAFDQMFNSNLRLVVYAAKKYLNSGLELFELINEGNIGLMKAIEEFDIDKGCKFSTYAIWWIKQSIRKNVLEQKHTLKISPNAVYEILNFKNKIELLEQEEKRKLTEEEIAKKLNIPLNKVTDYLKYDQNIVSIDQTITEEEDMTFKEVIESDENVELEITKSTLKDDIEPLFEILNERERKIIELRFGLNHPNGNTMTLVNIGKKLGLSTERIRQIESKALRKMRILSTKNNKCKSLKEYIH